MALSAAEKQAAYRRRQERQRGLFRGPPGVTREEQSFWRAFPAREGDMAPSSAQLKKLGGSF